MPAVSLYRLIPSFAATDPRIDNLFHADRARKEIALKQGFPGRLFVHTATGDPPEWATYLRPLTTKAIKLDSRPTAGAVLLVWPIKGKSLIYAYTWGMGHLLLRSDAIKSDLGLRAALNLMADPGDDWDPDRVRGLKTKRIGPTTMVSQIQASRTSHVESFPISIDGDQLRQITGTPLDVDTWGTSVTGAASLHVRRPASARALAILCSQVDKVYNSKVYRERYGWIDNVAPVADEGLETKALTGICADLAHADTSTVVWPPDIVASEEIATFEFHLSGNSRYVDEPSPALAAAFLTSLPDDRDPVADLRNAKLSILDAEGTRLNTWSLVKCLSAQITLGKRSYIYDEGSLFLVADDYLIALDKFCDKIPSTKLKYPKATARQSESRFNELVATTLKGALLLDKQNAVRNGASAIEVCDIALSDGQLIHVKRGRRSSSLSHLFSQGTVSADLLLMDSEFRQAVKRKLSTATLKGTAATTCSKFAWLWDDTFTPSKCSVRYAVVTASKTKLKPSALPFFSKVNLRQRVLELKRMGFLCSIDIVTY